MNVVSVSLMLAFSTCLLMPVGEVSSEIVYSSIGLERSFKNRSFFQAVWWMRKFLLLILVF